jgi:cytoskeletal protein CcmA (bactofilin family)
VVIVFGSVKGNITAGERIELAATARVTGDLSCDVVVLTDGAWFHGHIDMNRRTIAARVAHYMAQTALSRPGAAHPPA